MNPIKRLVTLLHDKTEGKIWTFPKSKTSYRVMDDGSYRRVSPERPWRGKSERRRHLKERREHLQSARELAMAS